MYEPLTAQDGIHVIVIPTEKKSENCLNVTLCHFKGPVYKI